MSELLIAAGLVAGAAAGLLLLLRSIIERNGPAAAMAALLLLTAAAGGLIVGSWGAPDAAKRWFQLAEFALMMAAGALSVVVIAALLRVDVPIAALFGIAAAVLVAAALATAVFGGDPILYGVPVQCLYVLYAWSLLARSRRVLDRRHKAYRQRLIAIMLLLALTTAVVASVVRTLFSEVRLLEPVVPLTISVLFLCLMGAALLMLMWRGAGLFALPGERHSNERSLASAAADLVRESGLHRKPDLKLEEVARRLGVSAAELSSALARTEWGSFAAMLQAFRIDCVAEMLRAPAERETSVEAIGLLCGFRSRSALYEAFRRNLGVTPGEYREQSCPEC